MSRHIQFDQVEPGMTIKLPNHGGRGRWVKILQVIETRPATRRQAAMTLALASYLNGKDVGKFQVMLYSNPHGYELHPNSALIAAKDHQRAGRAAVKNIVLRQYAIKLVAVDRVDDQDEICTYCCAGRIRCNVYAHTHTSDGDRVEESTWSTCELCVLHSIDQVQDVDPSHTVIVERAPR